MPYAPSYWQNSPTTTTPLSAAQLNALEARHGVNVDVLSANPAAETDWGPLINTAITNDARRLVFSDREYPYSTKIDFLGKTVSFQGSGAGRPSLGGTRTILQWKGTGAGNAIDANTTEFCTFKDMVFSYDSASYTGKQLLIGGCVGEPGVTAAIFENCSFYSTAARTSASCGVSLSDVVNVDFVSCYFRGDHYSTGAVRGRETAGAWANCIRFEFCTCQNRVLVNPGPNTVFDHCVFELNLTAGQAAIYMDAVGVGYKPTLTLDNCSYWDANPLGLAVVSMPATKACDFTAINCEDETSGVLSRTYKLLGNTDGSGSSSVKIIGGNATSPIDVGDAATSKKTLVYVHGCAVASVLNLNTGHVQVDVGGNDGLVTVGGITRTTSVIGVRRGTTPIPTVAISAGATGAVLGNYLVSDLSGIISVGQTGGSPSSTGDLVTVTLGFAPTLGLSAHEYLMAVSLNPIFVSGSGWGTVALATQATACKLYPKVTDNVVTSFKIANEVAIPVGAAISFQYFVTFIEDR